jgi:membrane protein required for beta-lactamase induction
MNLIALLVSLMVERLATQLFHWRRMRWLDRIIDRGFAWMASVSHWPAVVPVILLTLLLVAPVAIVTFVLGDALLGFPYLLLAIVVLFFSLGPKDVGEDVDEYCAAIEADDEEAIRQTARALIEGEVPDEPGARARAVESAVFVQANNRMFAVIFWFMVLGPLGPLGAWAYRVTDLIRRRAVFNAAREPAGEESATRSTARDAAVELHGWLAWLPARLTAIGYAIAGHFDGALRAWRQLPADRERFVAETNDLLLAAVGNGAMDLDRTLDAESRDEEDSSARAVRGATAANRLVFRQLLIWVVVIAALTLYGWTL